MTSDIYVIIIHALSFLTGILLSLYIFIHWKFFSENKGYLLKATKNLLIYLCIVVIVEWVIGLLFVFTINRLISFTVDLILSAIISFLIGVFVALIPTALESLSAPQGIQRSRLKKALIDKLEWLNITIIEEYAHTISSCREQDAYDLQCDAESLNIGINEEQIRRNMRKLYEVCKLDIAIKRQDSSFLQRDINSNTADKFYIVVRHIGRKALLRRLKNPSDFHSWDGKERRRKTGKKVDRISNAINLGKYRRN